MKSNISISVNKENEIYKFFKGVNNDFYLEIKIDSIDFNPERMVMISSNIDSKLYTSTI